MKKPRVFDRLGPSLEASRVADPAVADRSAPKPPARVLIVDDHSMIRLGLAALLSGASDLELCGEAEDAQTALRLVPELRPDLVIIDLTLPGMSGRELIQRLSGSHPKLPTLVLSLHDEVIEAVEALHAGARGYIMKQAPPPVLLEAMRQVLSGRIYLSPRMSTRLLERAAGRRPRLEASPLMQLSSRERDVFEMIGSGLGTRAIAANLNLSVKTVETYRAQIKQKLGLKDGAELTQRAVRWVLAL